jgi:hypothetical protein
MKEKMDLRDLKANIFRVGLYPNLWPDAISMCAFLAQQSQGGVLLCRHCLYQIPAAEKANLRKTFRVSSLCRAVRNWHQQC